MAHPVLYQAYMVSQGNHIAYTSPTFAGHYVGRHDTQHDDIQHNNKSIATLSIMPLSIMAIDSECCYAKSHLYLMSFVLSVTVKPFMLGAIMINVVIVSVVILNVVAPYIDPIFKLIIPVSSNNNSRVKTSRNICFSQVFQAVIVF